MKTDLPNTTFSQLNLDIPLHEHQSDSVRDSLIHCNLIYTGIGDFAPLMSLEEWLEGAAKLSKTQGTLQYLVNVFAATSHTLISENYKPNPESFRHSLSATQDFIKLLYIDVYQRQFRYITLDDVLPKLAKQVDKKQKTIQQLLNTLIHELRRLHPPKFEVDNFTSVKTPAYKIGDLVTCIDPLPLYHLETDNRGRAIGFSPTGLTVPPGTPLHVGPGIHPTPTPLNTDNPHLQYAAGSLMLDINHMPAPEARHWLTLLGASEEYIEAFEQKQMPRTRVKYVDRDIPFTKLLPYRLIDERDFHKPEKMRFQTDKLLFSKDVWEITVIPSKTSTALAFSAEYRNFSFFYLEAMSDQVSEQVFDTPHKVRIRGLFGETILDIGLTETGRIRIASNPGFPCDVLIDQNIRKIEVHLLFDYFILDFKEEKTSIGKILRGSWDSRVSNRINEDKYPIPELTPFGTK